MLYQSPFLYCVLREEDGTLSIEVVVGGIAMSTVRVRLTAQEAEAYARGGVPSPTANGVSGLPGTVTPDVYLRTGVGTSAYMHEGQ